MKPKNKQFILIVGMHRSGTSLVSQILNGSGVSFGENLLGKTTANPYGHLEDRFIIKCNEELLKISGGSWDAPPPKKSIQRTWNTSNSIKEKVTSYIKEDLINNESNFIGLKDPRFCLMLDEYMDILGDQKIIYIKRSHNEVARSINRRNGIDITYSEKLSEYYNTQASNSLKLKNEGTSIIIIDYKNLKEDSENTIKKILDFIEIKYTPHTIEKLNSKIFDKKQIEKDSINLKNTHLYFKAACMPHLAIKYIYSLLRRSILRKKWNVK